MSIIYSIYGVYGSLTMFLPIDDRNAKYHCFIINLDVLNFDFQVKFDLEGQG